MIFWTDERISALKKYWSEGFSASQIAAKIGGISRNAVIGKVHRLNLPGRTSGGSATVKIKQSVTKDEKRLTVVKTVKRAVKKGSVSETVTPEVVTSVQEESIPVNTAQHIPTPIIPKITVVSLNDQMCRWPSGDPLQEGFGFCGHQTAKPSPYCSYHSRLAFQPSTGRRKQQ